MVKEAILSRLSTKAGWHDVNTARGGVPEFNTGDVIAALPLIDRQCRDAERLPSAMVMYYYVRELAYMTQVSQAMSNKVMHRRIEGLPVLQDFMKPHLYHLIRLSLLEVLGGLESVRCRSCRGRHETRKADGSVETCDYCTDGWQPRVKLGPTKRAEVLSAMVGEPISRYMWMKFYAELYEAVSHEFAVALGEGLKCLKGALGS